MVRLYKYSLINLIKYIICSYLIFIQFNLINCYFHLFLNYYYRGRSAINLNGDIIIEYSYYNYRRLYGLRQNGKLLCDYVFELEEYNYRDYAKNIYVSLKNDSSKQYLFSTGAYSITEIYNISSGKCFYENTSDYLGDEIYSESFSILSLNNLNEYAIIYISNSTKYYTIQKFSFSQFSLSSLIYEKKEINISIDHKTVNGFIMNDKIVVFYLNYNNSNNEAKRYSYYINSYHYNLSLIKENIYIGEAFFLKGKGTFFKGLHLKYEIMAFCYYGPYSFDLKIGNLSDDGTFNTLLKKDINNNTIFYSGGLKNDFIKLSDERLVLIGIRYNKDSKFGVILIDFYNDYKYMKIRKYMNDNLNFKYKASDLELNIYNDYLALSASLYEPTIINGETRYYRFSIFMIFGYINGTDFEYINLYEYFMDDYYIWIYYIKGN